MAGRRPTQKRERQKKHVRDTALTKGVAQDPWHRHGCPMTLSNPFACELRAGHERPQRNEKTSTQSRIARVVVRLRSTPSWTWAWQKRTRTKRYSNGRAMS